MSYGLFTNPNLYICAVLTIFLASCASTRGKNWQDLKASEEFKVEKEQYKTRLGGQEFCWGIGVEDFLTVANMTPKKNCIYPASKMVVENEGLLTEKNELKQRVKQLKIFQVTPSGFVVQSSYSGRLGEYPIDQVIFIHKTDETGIVDGAYLDESNWLLYEYSGPFSYTTLAGSKTVHSFRKISSDRFEAARKGLNSYSPTKDFLIENHLWDRLDELK